MATANWNDLPDDLLHVGRVRAGANGSGRSTRRSSQSPHLGPDSTASESNPRHNGLASMPPRRKPSHPSRTQQTRKPLAETHLPTDVQTGGIFSVNYFGHQSDGTLHPLRDVANRVGREVEQFAEQVDQWKQHRSEQPPTNQAESALELVRHYKKVAGETVEKLRKNHIGELRKRIHTRLSQRILPSAKTAEAPLLTGNEESPTLASRASTTVDDLVHWQDEYNTWQLYEALLEVRMCGEQEKIPKTTLPLMSDQDRFAADGKAWVDFLEQDGVARERLIVLKWLQSTGEEIEDDCDMIQDRFEAASGRAGGLWVHGWLQTRERLKQEKRLRMLDAPIDGPAAQLPPIRSSRDATKLLVTQLDPDAVFRQQRGLEPQDETLEHASWAMLWEMLRRGKPMDEIRIWCHEQYAYSNIYMLGANSPSSEGVMDAASVKSRWAWRMSCLQAARHGGINDYERAVLGLLAGDHNTAARVCLSWEDHLFVSINQMLVHQYQQFVLNREPQLAERASGFQLVVDDAITTSLKSGSTALGLLKSLQRKDGSRLSFSERPLKLMQSGLIFGNVGEVAAAAGRLIARELLKKKQPNQLGDLIPEELRAMALANDADGHDQDATLTFDALRVIAHMIIIETAVGLHMNNVSDHAACELVIVAWINFLAQAGKLSLVPSYVGLLAGDKRAKVMARVLPFVTNDGQQADFVRLIEAAGIDVYDTVLRHFATAQQNSKLSQSPSGMVVKNPILEHTLDKSWPRVRISSPVADMVTDEEESLIQTLEWFKYLDGHFISTFQHAKSLAFKFLAAGRLSATIELTKRVAPTPLSLIKTAQVFGTSSDIIQLVNAKGTVAVYQAQARGYYDVGMLTGLINFCWTWRSFEDLSSTSRDKRMTESGAEVLGELWRSLQDILHEDTFLQAAVTPSTDVKDAWSEEAELLEVLRTTYVPDVILAYNSAAYFSDRREHLQNTRLVAQAVALKPWLQQAFIGAKRMGELVEGLALSNAKLLELEDQPSRGLKKSHVRRMSTSTAKWGAGA